MILTFVVVVDKVYGLLVRTIRSEPTLKSINEGNRVSQLHFGSKLIAATNNICREYREIP